MSISIEQNPQTYSPVFNPIDFTCSSNNLSHNYFYYLVRIRDSGGSIIYQDRFSPRYDNQLLLFNAQRALEKYCTYDISGIATPTYGVRYAANVYKEYTVDFIEETGSVASAVASGSYTSTGTRYAYNGVFNFEDFCSYDDDNWVMNTSTKPFLTDMRGANIRIKENQHFDLGIMTSAGASAPVKKIVVKTYDYSGSLIGTYKFDNAYASQTTTEAKFLNVLVGTSDLNNTTLSSGSQPLITSNVNTYTVQVENNSGTIISETLTFEIDRRCNNSDYLRLYWVNTLGRIDAFNFNFDYDKSVNVKRSQFRKLNGEFSGVNYLYKTYEQSNVNFYTEVNRKLKVRTDYINNYEAEWLQHLLSSPAVWAEIDGNLISVNIDDESYNIQTIEKNRLFNAEFNLTYSVSNYRQRL